MQTTSALYKSYLLRMCLDQERCSWRVRLEEIGKDPVVLHFTDLESFAAFLLSESLNGPAESPTPPTP